MSAGAVNPNISSVPPALEVIGPEKLHRDTFWTRWYRNRSFVAGCCILGVIVCMIVAAPILAPRSATQQNLTNILQAPSHHHLLGTDELGIDVWSQLLRGLGVDMRIALLAVIFPFILGVALGCLSGYFGGWVDIGVMRLVDIVVAFPFYVLVIALVFVLGPGARSIYIAITIVGWVSYARIVRGEILVAKQQDYVQAGRAAGFSTFRIVVRHLLPNVITQAIVFATSDIVLDMLAIVTLGYLGLGVPRAHPGPGAHDLLRSAVPDDPLAARHHSRSCRGHRWRRARAGRGWALRSA